MNRIPVEPTPELRRRAERDSILSTCFGAVGDITLADSAVIILYATMIGAGDMFALLTTALMPLMNGVCLIPMAFFAARAGYQTLIARVIGVSVVMFLLIAAAPWFGSAAAWVLIVSLTLFSFFHTGYAAAWFPMLDTFLTPDRRGAYFSRMRFCWQASSWLFILLVGLAIGRTPPLWALQVVLFLAAILFSGRIWCILRIPVFTVEQKERPDLRRGLGIAVGNKALTGYSAYLFMLGLASSGTIPLVMLYLKRHLVAPDNVTVVLSSATMLGMLTGSLTGGLFLRKLGVRKIMLGVHLIFFVCNVCFFLIGKHTMPPIATYTALTVLLLVYSATSGVAYITSSCEMMALATPGNKTMAMALCGTLSSTGAGLSRILGSLIIGAGLLATEWSWGGMTVSFYQTVFLVYACLLLVAAVFLLIVPAVFPNGVYRYTAH